MKKVGKITSLWMLVCLLLAVTPARGQAVRLSQGRDRGQPSRAASRTPAQARLVLLIVVDQFREDFLERFGDLFGEGGFRRLVNGGALFTNANYDYVPTYTAPGHAAISTGSVPALNGIVGNTWFDRESGRVRLMVSDNAAHLVTSAGV